MRLILRNNTNPYFNIAAEEYFLKNYDEDIIMFWKSSPSVIVGKHQNTMAEVNISFALSNNIPVIRRISGGGTVYHDFGNINYTIITSSKNREKLVDFVNFTKPIIGFLDSMGLKAKYEGKNNLTINGKKFSGNSAHVFKNRILNHGTILFNTNLNYLETSIMSRSTTFSDKSVKSIRANVANIVEHLSYPISIDTFLERLIKYFTNYFNIDITSQLTDNDAIKINELVNKKYKLWDWNYGYSPSYNYSNEVSGKTISMDVKNGKIESLILNCNNSYDSQICNNLLNVKYKYEVIENVMTDLKMSNDALAEYKALFGIRT